MSNSKVAVIAGYGSGISGAVAKKCGDARYKLALLARTKSRLDAAGEEFKKAGIDAKGYSTDLSNPAAIKETIAAVHNDLGPIRLLFWNPYGKAVGLFEATPDDLVSEYNTAVTGLLTAVQAAHEDLSATKGTILVTSSGFFEESDSMVQTILDWNASSLAIAKTAQRKLVHLLSKGLAKDGIYAAQVNVYGLVKGTAWDPESTSELTAEDVADVFWELHEKRDPNVWYVIKKQPGT